MGGGRPLLLSSIGLPGSGKSTFLSRFAEEQDWFYWSNDEARRRIFAEPKHSPQEHEQLGRTSSYVFHNLLSVGQSAVYDVNLNRRFHREKSARLAARYGGEFWLLWFQVPDEVALARVKRRAEEAEGEQKRYYETFDPDFFHKLKRNLEEPKEGERVILVDGEAPYEEQVRSVLTGLQLAGSNAE